MKFKLKIVFLILFFAHKQYTQELIINELLSSNQKSNFDGFGEYDDWIEIYNPTDSIININGMFISDDLSDPTKHCLVSKNIKWLEINPTSYFLLWMDSDPEQGSRHVSFKLKKEKGGVYLFSKDTVLIDSITYHHQQKDISIGRLNPGNNKLALFEKPTPKKENSNGLELSSTKFIVSADQISGLYNDSISVRLVSENQGSIYYTTDGSEPNHESEIYTEPLIFDSNTILRYRLIKDGFVPGDISTNTYLINEESSLPVISLITDPKYLWNKKKGIYYKYEKRGWERSAYVEYFDRSQIGEFDLAFSKSVDIRIAGKTSRRQPKKSFAIFANDLDGKDRIDYQLFKDKDISSFGGFWVRADATSGRNVSDLWVGERFKNELIYEVNSQMNGNIDMQAYEPVLLFLNGEYWGLYNMMERKGKDFIKNNHNIKDVDILTGENTKLVSGKMNDYDELIFYVTTNDLSIDSVYENVCNMMDVNSYIDYWINETYCGAKDINVNIRYWKSKDSDGKWRWISYDQDSWYRSDEQSLNYYLDDGKVFLLSRLVKNNDFREQWINRLCDYLNTGFKESNVINLVDQITDRISLEIPREKSRWQDTMLYIPTNQRINWIKNYAKERPDFLRNHFIDYFSINGEAKEIEVVLNKGNGSIKINSIHVEEDKWKGVYIENIPIEIEAVPDEGYEFVKWKNRKLSKKSKLIINPKEIKKLIPVFEKSSNFISQETE